jgi:multiple sugar transport system permease protein
MNPRRATLGSAYAIALAIGLLIFGFPLYWMIRGALISQAAWVRVPLEWWPHHPRLDAFRQIFDAFRMPRVLLNTALVAGLTMLLNVIFDTAAGFALAKMRVPGRRSIYLLLLITMMVPFEGLMVPLYLVVTRMGLANSIAGIVLPGAASAFCIVLMRHFFTGVPDELIEAAVVDGAGWGRIFMSVAVPLARPAIATVAIISFLAGWESFVWPLLITDPQSEFDVLPKVIAQATFATVGGAQDVQWPWLMAAALIATLPVLLLFIFCQRFFIEGLSRGALKG